MSRSRSTGFTLLEVVAVIVFSAIAMAAILPFLGNVFLRSAEPRLQLHDGLRLQAAMDALIAEHVAMPTNDLRVFQRRVTGVVTAVGADISVRGNQFVRFTNGQEVAATTTRNLLRITLQNAQGETMTRLFTEQLRQ